MVESSRYRYYHDARPVVRAHRLVSDSGLPSPPPLSSALSVGNIVSISNDVGMLFVSGLFKHASWKMLRSGLTGTATVTVQAAPKPAADGFIFNSKAYDEESTVGGDSAGAEGSTQLATAPLIFQGQNGIVQVVL